MHESINIGENRYFQPRWTV